MRRRRSLIFTTLVALGLITAASACGGGGGDGGDATVTATNGKVTITAKAVKFDARTIRATAGDLTVTFVNDDTIPHDFSVHEFDEQGLRATADPGGGEATATFPLEAGKTYRFYCSVFGGAHEAQGMKGTIVVE